MSDKSRSKKLQELLLANRAKRTVQIDGVFKDCLQALNTDVSTLSETEGFLIYKMLQDKFPFTSWGRIDWSKVNKKISIEHFTQVISELKTNITSFNTSIYILWGYGDYPVIKTNIEKAISIIDNIVAVGSDQWLLSQTGEYVIEVYHEGETKMGIL